MYLIMVKYAKITRKKIYINYATLSNATILLAFVDDIAKFLSTNDDNMIFRLSMRKKHK